MVEDVSELNEKLYSLFVRPCLQPLVTQPFARAFRALHPLRVQHWTVSDLNPFLWALPPLASFVNERTAPVDKDNTFKRTETAFSENTDATLNLYGDLRAGWNEAAFFTLYGGMLALGMVEYDELTIWNTPARREKNAFVRETLAKIEQGGYAEAMMRIAALLGKGVNVVPLSTLAVADEWVKLIFYTALAKAV